VIIDADTHISPTGEDAMAITIDELIRRLDRAKVDKALTWLRPPYMRAIDESNAYVYRATQQHPDRILGFGWADPHLGLDEAREAIRRCMDDYGFYGVKLNGAQNNFYIDDAEMSLPLVEEIARSGKLLAFHVGADAFEHTHPFRVAKVARMFPEFPILMVHMGGVGHHALTDAAIEIAQECTNITLIGSGVRARPILKAIKVLGTRRVCFGSDTPFELTHVEVAKYHAMLDGEVTPQEKHLIMAGNIANLMGLDIS
jgi:predicted TIM-barrel fold metal-dependent hydrolase